MRTTINGEERELDAEASLAQVLAELRIPPKGTAVAVNDRVVPKTEYEGFRVREGDRIEIIVAVAGG